MHIADVSYFVDDDGEIEREARRRTSSLYLPLFAEPMLPAALSSDLCSLVPRQPRKCLTVEFTFDAAGRRTATQYYRSLISSDHRLTYGFADTVIGPAAVDAAGGAEDAAGAEAAAVPLADPKAAVAALPGAHLVAGGRSRRATCPTRRMQADEALREQLLLAAELAGVLRRRRLTRGALTIGSFEPEYAFDHAGALSGAAARPETPSHALVGGVHARRQRSGGRVPPAQEGSRALPRARATRAGEHARAPRPARGARGGYAAVPGRRDGARGAAAEFYGRLSRLVAQASAREHRGRLAWSTLILRSLKQARYAPGNLGHFGLASPAYLHFTSPIRRYPDLVTHRALLYHLGEGGSELGEAELATAADDCSTREREFSRAELTGDDIALCFLLVRRLDAEGWEEPFTGEIVGLVGGGLFVRFGEVFEGFLSSRRLGGERFEVSEHETALVGEATGTRYRLGDAVDVKVERVDRLTGKVDLAPAVPDGGGPRTAPGRRPARRTTGSRPPRRRTPGRQTRRQR